ncbi:MAG: tRNA (adenosine(37)-N6)-threonylcarbamoyltransferase complex dimerization subunit type 1 TsaB [Planctomycetota bacterium]|nr:tRNA (adenosine(37)-N6)-threonylcarbamoyltransferase complex dimerization subunit type 1 TsaB [Planctomycetota bacterium]MDG2142348.1 tRNA (adenosine(37)-N6)-threonylcarbamoyltransferase complex dimerization subunit type 1 TsaB [Planctomycetota bacterium]
MIAAAFETSTRSASVALAIGDDFADAGRLEFVVGALDGAAAHASDLLPRLAEMLGERGLQASDLDAVLVGLGPGSYTGLRVSVATALGLALGKVDRRTPQLLGVPSCEALLGGSLAEGERGAWIQDARSGGFYTASGRMTGNFELQTQPAVVDQAGLEHFLSEQTGARLLGDEATGKTLERIGVAANLEFVTPTAQHVLQLGLPRLARDGGTAPAQLAPLYLRPFAVKVRKR